MYPYILLRLTSYIRLLNMRNAQLPAVVIWNDGEYLVILLMFNSKL